MLLVDDSKIWRELEKTVQGFKSDDIDENIMAGKGEIKDDGPRIERVLPKGVSGT